MTGDETQESDNSVSDDDHIAQEYPDDLLQSPEMVVTEVTEFHKSQNEEFIEDETNIFRLPCDGCIKTQCCRCAIFTDYSPLNRDKNSDNVCGNLVNENIDCKRRKTLSRLKKIQQKCEKFTDEVNEIFDFSLFPRKTVTDESDIGDRERGYESDHDHAMDTAEDHWWKLGGKMYTRQKIGGNGARRANRHRKMEKARKQRKTKHCKSVRNNECRKRIYVRSRVYMRMYRLEDICHEMRVSKSKVSTQKIDIKDKSTTRSRKDPLDTKYALNSGNAPTQFRNDANLVSALTSIQHRDLTPEDYDLLLQLDDVMVPAKTASEDTMSRLRVDRVSEEMYEPCVICMGCYSVGDTRMHLPCEHSFHKDCIERWLTFSSPNCPLDGLPIS